VDYHTKVVDAVNHQCFLTHCQVWWMTKRQLRLPVVRAQSANPIPGMQNIMSVSTVPSVAVPTAPVVPTLTPELLVAILAGNDPKRVQITPEMAAVILRDYNRHNRPLFAVTSTHYADVMKRGEWTYTGDAIRFYPGKGLADGQHRLDAAVKAGYTLDVVIIPNFPEDAIIFIDGPGRRRTPSEALSLRKVSNSDIVSGAVTLILRIGESKGNVSVFDVVTYSALHEAELKASVAFTTALFNKYPNSDVVTNREVAAWHYSAIRAGCPVATIESFLDALVANEDDGSVPSRLGNELIKAREEASSGYTSRHRWAALVECFTHFAKGGPGSKTIKALVRGKNKKGKVSVPSWPSTEPSAVAVPPPLAAAA